VLFVELDIPESSSLSSKRYSLDNNLLFRLLKWSPISYNANIWKCVCVFAHVYVCGCASCARDKNVGYFFFLVPLPILSLETWSPTKLSAHTPATLACQRAPGVYLSLPSSFLDQGSMYIQPYLFCCCSTWALGIQTQVFMLYQMSHNLPVPWFAIVAEFICLWWFESGCLIEITEVLRVCFPSHLCQIVIIRQHHSPFHSWRQICRNFSKLPKITMTNWPICLQGDSIPNFPATVGNTQLWKEHHGLRLLFWKIRKSLQGGYLILFMLTMSLLCGRWEETMSLYSCWHGCVWESSEEMKTLTFLSLGIPWVPSLPLSRNCLVPQIIIFIYKT
jgi:hypothetical protein